MAQIIIADIECYDESLPGVRTLQYATQSFVTPKELVRNGNFASGTTGWTGSNATLSNTGGALVITQVATGTAGYAWQAIRCEVGRSYTLTATLIADTTTGNPNFNIGSIRNIGTEYTFAFTTPTRIISSFIATSTTEYVAIGNDSTATAGQSSTWGEIYIHEGILDGNTFYDGRIQQPANVKRTCFEDGKTAGRTQISYGDMVLLNNDGALDDLLNYSFSGRKITIRLGVVKPNSNRTPTWTNVISGVMEQAQFSWQKITIRVRDRQQDLAKPIQQTRYGGTNALPNGLDGVATDIAGRPKPMVFGQVFNVTMPCVNTTRLIFQLHHGSALTSVDGVYDRGAPLTAGAAYTSQTDMETNTPITGQYRVWNSAAGTYIRVATNPSGPLTADATQGFSVGNRTAGQLWITILYFMGINTNYVEFADVTALDTLVSYPVGVFVPHDRDVTALELLDEICNSVGAWYGIDSNGKFRIGRIDVPIGTSVGAITATEIIKIERIASRDKGVGIPAWKIKLGYQRIYTLQNDLTNTVTAVRKSYLAQEYRRIEASNSAVLTANLTSPEIEFKTNLVLAADATAEAARRLAIYKTQRNVYEVTVRVDETLAGFLDLGKIITLQIDRYGMSAGKKFLIIGIRANMRGYVFDLTLWG